jgi:hypothetical protein
MRVFFDVQHLYYLPQYLPVYDELTKAGVTCEFILYRQKELNTVLLDYSNKYGLVCGYVNNCHQAREVYLKEKPEWIVFGNAFDNIKEINKHSKTALMEHGIGPKATYYDVSMSDITYRFVEGKHRLNRLEKRFPQKNFINTGFAKLDPIINQTLEKLDLEKIGLSNDKETILYAPTFYPSSIECLPSNFPVLFQDYNIIIKPHFFSLIKEKYKAHRLAFECWDKYKNVYIAKVDDVSSLPFMDVASIIISDTSSMLFEFTALNKPAIWCDFYKVRWSYRGLFKSRLKNRLDEDLKYFGKVAQRVTNNTELAEQTLKYIKNPELKEPERQEMTELLTGKVDGLCSKRIANFITSDIIKK